MRRVKSRPLPPLKVRVLCGVRHTRESERVCVHGLSARGGVFYHAFFYIRYRRVCLDRRAHRLGRPRRNAVASRLARVDARWRADRPHSFSTKILQNVFQRPHLQQSVPPILTRRTAPTSRPADRSSVSTICIEACSLLPSASAPSLHALAPPRLPAAAVSPCCFVHQPVCFCSLLGLGLMVLILLSNRTRTRMKNQRKKKIKPVSLSHHFTPP